MKIGYIFIIITIFMISLAGCNKYEHKDTNVTDSVEERLNEYKESKQKNNNGSMYEYSTEVETDQNYSLQSDSVEEVELQPFTDEYISEIIINGEKLTVPMSFLDLENAGWVYEGDSTKKISANTSQESQRWNKDGVKLFTTITNFSINSMPYKDCIITKLDYKCKPYNSGIHDVKLATGITIYKSVYEDVKSIYGEADRIHDGNEYKIVRYIYDEEHEAIFSFDVESDILTNVGIKCEDEPQNINNEINEERPKILDTYVEPTEKSNSPYDGIFELDGELYTLPCPVEKFIENGWHVGNRDQTAVISGTSEFYTLEKDDIKLDVILENYVDDAVYAKYAYVTQIWADLDDGINIPFKVHGDISLGEKIEVEELQNKYNDMLVTLNDSYDDMVIVNMDPINDSDIQIEYSMVIKNGILESILMYCFTW